MRYVSGTAESSGRIGVKSPSAIVVHLLYLWKGMVWESGSVCVFTRIVYQIKAFISLGKMVEGKGQAERGGKQLAGYRKKVKHSQQSMVHGKREESG
jgi:hypothetical protein